MSRVSIALFAIAAGSAFAADLPPPADRRIDFDRDVRPILVKHCHGCHGPDKQKSGLRLDRKTDAVKGGDDGVVIVPGKSAESLIVQLVAGLDKDRVMPPKGERLTAAQIGILRAWIDQGADWPGRRRKRRSARLVVAAAAGSAAAPALGRGRAPGSQPRRSLRSRQAAREGDLLRPRSRPPHAHSPALLRPDRPAADAGRSRGLRRRRDRQTRTRSWSIGCSPRRTTASAGPGTGSTSSTTATRTATTRTSRGRTPGRIATT